MTDKAAITKREKKLTAMAENRAEILAVQARCEEQLAWTHTAIATNDDAQQVVRAEIELLKTGVTERELDDAMPRTLDLIHNAKESTK